MRSSSCPVVAKQDGGNGWHGLGLLSGEALVAGPSATVHPLRWDTYSSNDVHDQHCKGLMTPQAAFPALHAFLPAFGKLMTYGACWEARAMTTSTRTDLVQALHEVGTLCQQG